MLWRTLQRASALLSALAKAFHVLRILGEILGQALHRAGKIAGHVIT